MPRFDIHTLFLPSFCQVAGYGFAKEAFHDSFSARSTKSCAIARLFSGLLLTRVLAFICVRNV
jgi:hypothetical protein